MRRDSRVRRAQLVAGIVIGVIVGTVHALVVHVASHSDVLEEAAASWAVGQAIGDDGPTR